MEEVLNEMKKEFSDWKTLREVYKDVFDYVDYDIVMRLLGAADKHLANLEKKLTELEKLIK